MKKLKGSTSNYIQILTFTGLLTAVALLVKSFSTYVYIAGAPVLRVGFSGPFTQLPALLFGPITGAIAQGLVDIIGYLLKPTGAYIPLLTITAIFQGLLTGFLWRKVKKWNENKIRRILLILFTGIGLIGIINHFTTLFLPDSGWGILLSMLGAKLPFVTIVLEITALGGYVIIFSSNVLRKKLANYGIHESYLKLVIALGIPGLLVTTFNTEILRLFIPGLASKAFLLFWIPRLIEQMLAILYQSYIASILLQLYYRLSRNSIYSKIAREQEK